MSSRGRRGGSSALGDDESQAGGTQFFDTVTSFSDVREASGGTWDHIGARRIDPQVAADDPPVVGSDFAWTSIDPHFHRVRGPDYMTTRKKVKPLQNYCMYELIDVEIINSNLRVEHVAPHLEELFPHLVDMFKASAGRFWERKRAEYRAEFGDDADLWDEYEDGGGEGGDAGAGGADAGVFEGDRGGSGSGGEESSGSTSAKGGRAVRRSGSSGSRGGERGSEAAPGEGEPGTPPAQSAGGGGMRTWAEFGKDVVSMAGVTSALKKIGLAKDEAREAAERERESWWERRIERKASLGLGGVDAAGAAAAPARPNGTGAPAGEPNLDDDASDFPEFFIVSCAIPSYKPVFWAEKNPDGETRTMILIFGLGERGRQLYASLCRDPQTRGQARLMHDFFVGPDPTDTSKDETAEFQSYGYGYCMPNQATGDYLSRSASKTEYVGTTVERAHDRAGSALYNFKAIPGLFNIDELEKTGVLGRTEASFLRQYCFKPCMTGPMHHVVRGPGYTECIMDTHTHSYPARVAIESYGSRFEKQVLQIMFVLEGRNTDELPEVPLCGGRLYYPDYAKARRLHIPDKNREGTVYDAKGNVLRRFQDRPGFNPHS